MGPGWMDVVFSGIRWQTYQESDANVTEILTRIGKNFESFLLLDFNVKPTIDCHRLRCFKYC